MRNSKVESTTENAEKKQWVATQNSGKKNKTRPSYLYISYIPQIRKIMLPFVVPFCLLLFFVVKCSHRGFFEEKTQRIHRLDLRIQVSSNAKTSGSRGMWNWTLKRRSNAIFIRQPRQRFFGFSQKKKRVRGGMSSRWFSPLFDKCILF